MGVLAIVAVALVGLTVWAADPEIRVPMLVAYGLVALASCLVTLYVNRSPR